MKICLRFVTELQLKLKLAGAVAAALTFCWALFYVTFRSLRYVAFRSFVRFSVCPKTFFHMHLSAKACHTPLPLLLLRPSSRLDTTLFDFGVPCRYGSAALFAIFHKILNIPFSLSWSIGTLFKSEQPLHFVYLALLFFLLLLSPLPSTPAMQSHKLPWGI